jgi:hypothetical protein
MQNDQFYVIVGVASIFWCHGVGSESLSEFILQRKIWILEIIAASLALLPLLYPILALSGVETKFMETIYRAHTPFLDSELALVRSNDHIVDFSCNIRAATVRLGSFRASSHEDAISSHSNMLNDSIAMQETMLFA